MVRRTAERRRSSRGIKGTWTREDLQMLRKLFPARSTSEVAGELHRGLDAVKKKASRMGLRKNRSYMKSLGRA